MYIQIQNLLLRENIGNASFVNFNRKIILIFFPVKAAKSCLAVATVLTLSIQLPVPSLSIHIVLPILLLVYNKKIVTCNDLEEDGETPSTSNRST
jgi:hypothetical protein